MLPVLPSLARPAPPPPSLAAPSAFIAELLNPLKYFLSLNEAPAGLKTKLAEAMKLKGSWDSQRQELAQIVLDLNRLNLDQERIRKNLANTPKEAEVYTVYLKKLSDQEKEIDGLTAKQKKTMGDEFAAKKSYEDYLANLTE